MSIAYNRGMNNKQQAKGNEIMKNSTLARINGLAVVILDYCHDFCQVRYVGAKGKEITKQPFQVDTNKLKKF